MRVIGITGPTGAGKTTALGALVALGGEIIDADAVYHALTANSDDLRRELTERFGPVYENGQLARKKLGAIVFQDPAALEDLNAITHKYISQAVGARLDAARAQGRLAAAIDAIALLEGGLLDFCDCTVAITAPEALRIRRIMAREGISEEYARMRVSAQQSSAWFKARCDYCLENDEGDTPESFAQRAQALFREIIAQSVSETKAGALRP